jgi:DNA-binding GntR family transcriptional regulator
VTATDRAADFTLKDAEWPRTLADRAFVMLRDAIVTAEIKPGQRLRLDEIAERLGMSVMPAREALKRLEASGLIEFEPHRGATVAPLAAHELSELFEIRLMIEVPAIRRGAEGFGFEESDTVAATDALDAYHHALLTGDFGQATVCHQRFHLALYRAHTYPLLGRTLSPLWEASSRYWHHLTQGTGWQPEERKSTHQVLLELCLSHDSNGAAAELERHLMFGRDVLMKAMTAASSESRSVPSAAEH